MAVSSVVAVGTSAGLVLTGQGPSADQYGSSALIENNGAVTVYLGGAGVTSANGFPLPAGATLSLDMGTSESLYAVAASAGELRVLQVG